MKTKEFLAQLNNSSKEWGLWINRENLDENHVGHYPFEHDNFPKSFIHAGSLEQLAHLRQQYIVSSSVTNKSEHELGEEWAEDFLSQWTVST